MLPDNTDVQTHAGETMLEAIVRSGIAHACACDGHPRCSTCRVAVESGVGFTAPRTEAEEVLAECMDFGRSLRLGCQTITYDDLVVRRLLLDNDDPEMIAQRRLSSEGTGEEHELAILFAARWRVAGLVTRRHRFGG